MGYSLRFTRPLPLGLKKYIKTIFKKGNAPFRKNSGLNLRSFDFDPSLPYMRYRNATPMKNKSQNVPPLTIHM